jgi:hypothetical protein
VQGKHIGLTKHNPNYRFEPSLINRLIKREGKEYINFKGKKIFVYDTGLILNDTPMKRFDGVLFIYSQDGAIGIKTEGFFSENEFCNTELSIDKAFEFTKAS